MRNDNVRVVHPTNVLRKILTGSRVGRDAAVARANVNLQEIHGDLAAGLASELRRLCVVADGSGPLSDSELSSVLAAARVLFNLSGILGNSDLQSVIVGLQDLVTLMVEQGLHCREPISVHVRAATILGPNMPKLEPGLIKQLRRELEAVLSHLEMKPSPCDVTCVRCPARSDAAVSKPSL